MDLMPFSELEVQAQKRIAWKLAPDEHNYENAYEYLSLLLLPKNAHCVIDRLKDCETVLFRRPGHILRAAGLNCLPQTNMAVQQFTRQIHRGEEIAPALIVTGKRNDRIHLADGYHRLCAAHYYAEGLKMPCVIAEWD
jgi:hypothetical protein